MADEQRRFTATKAAQRVGIAYSTMRAHVRSGRVAAEREGRSLLIEEAELRREYPHAFSADETPNRADVRSEGADRASDGAIAGMDSADGRVEDADRASDGAIASVGDADRASDGAIAGVEGADRVSDGAIAGMDSAGGSVEDADRTSDGAISDMDSADPADVGMERVESASLRIEVEVLRVKLESRERENETLRTDVDHLRGLTVQQADSVHNLTEEVKGLTVALHREQERHALAASPVEEPIREPRPGLWKRWFGQSRRTRHVRIGHA